MIVDTSALVAILTQEPDGPALGEEVAAAAWVGISAVTLVEAAMVLEARGGPAAGRRLEHLVAELAADICPVTERTARLAQEGWRRFGKGRHPARLNLGDCFSYALAQERGEPLLFKGDDFAQTDVKRAI